MHHPITRLYLFFADVLALVATLFFSAAVSEFVMGHGYLDLKTFDGIERLLSFGIISVIVLFIFFNRGHYARRIPWWSQLRFVVLTCVMAFIIDGFMHFAIKYQFSRLWIGLSWLYASLFILLMRYLAKQLIDKLFHL